MEALVCFGPFTQRHMSMRETLKTSPGLRRHLSALINWDQHLIPLHCPSGKESHTHSTLMSSSIWLTGPFSSFSSAWVCVALLKIRIQFLSFYLSLVTFHWILKVDTMSYKGCLQSQDGDIFSDPSETKKCKIQLEALFFLVVQVNQTEKINRYVPDDFQIDPDFKRLVSYNTTGVHIPTDIYEGCKLRHKYTCTHNLCMSVIRILINHHLPPRSVSQYPCYHCVQ